METCNPFDDALAAIGPAAVFLRDRSGLWKCDLSWTRDAWGRAPGPHAPGVVFVLLRDHDTGFVTLVMCTSPTLLASWPRADVRAYPSEAEADAARAAFGSPPVTRGSWA
jgi:hypothetical protein